MRISRAILATTLWTAAMSAQALKDVDGVAHGSLGDGARKAAVLFFVLTDCPISNHFAPEIDRICDAYEPKGAECFLVYVDPEKTDSEIREHASQFGHGGRPALHDLDRTLTNKAGATITPEAAVFSAAGEMLYRGRINNLYASLGKQRRQATEHDLRRALDEALAGKAISTPRTQAVGCYLPPKEL